MAQERDTDTDTDTDRGVLLRFAQLLIHHQIPLPLSPPQPLYSILFQPQHTLVAIAIAISILLFFYITHHSFICSLVPSYFTINIQHSTLVLQMTPFSDFFSLLLNLRRPIIRRAATWTALMTTAVVLSSFTPEFAFVWALSHPHTAAQCKGDLVWVPLDTEGACLPPRTLNRSTADVFVPPVFAALVVGASALFVRAVAWGRTENLSEMG